MTESIKVVEVAVPREDFYSSVPVVPKECCVAIVLKFRYQPRLGPERNNVISPAAMGAAPICFQNHIGYTIAVNVAPCNLNRQSPIVITDCLLPFHCAHVSP